MVNATSDISSTQTTAQPSEVSTQSSSSKSSSTSTSTAAPSAPPPAATVQISSAALAALKEAQETPAQTAKEAASGDIQAKKLLAKEVADAKL